jgi:hypothetical protein
MAGLGRRTFAPGEVLTASNVMNYLQDQVVQTYAGTAARGSAIGTAVSEGMISYVADTNSVEVYDGSDWLGLGPSNNIVQIVTGTTTTSVVSNTSTFIDTGLQATITPRKSTNKILVLVSQSFLKTAASSLNRANIRLLRGATVLQTAQSVFYTATALEFRGYQSFHIIDEPATTSAITYKTQFMNEGNTAAIQANIPSAFCQITLIEIQG